MIFLNTALAASPRYRQTVEPAPGVTYDEDFQAKIDYADANGIPIPYSTWLDAENQRVLDYKASDAWALEDSYYDFKGVDDTFISWRLIDTKRRVQASQYGSLVWTSDGVKGNGGYIDLNFIPSVDGVNYTLNDAGLLAYMNTITVQAAAIFGVYQGNATQYTLWHPSRRVDNGYFWINGGSDFASTGNAGLNALYRLNSSELRWHSGGYAGFSTASASGGLPTHSIYLLARHRADTGSADLFSSDSIRMATIGASKHHIHDQIKALTF